jgi:hypothetical protein
MAGDAAALDRVRTLAGYSRVAALIAIIAMWITVISTYVLAPVVKGLRSIRSEPAWGPFWPAEVILKQMILALPIILFIDALGQMRKALSEYEQGRFFSKESARAVRRAGEDGLLALAAHIVISPTVHGWVTEGPGFKVNFEFFYLGLIAFAIFITAIGRVLHAAAAIKAEHDQIV